MSLTTQTIAQALGCSTKSVIERASAEGWLFQPSGNRKLWVENSLPADVRLKVVAKVPDPQVTPVPATTGLFTQASKTSQQKAIDKALFLKAMAAHVKRVEFSVSDFIAAYNAGVVLVGVKKRLGEVSPATAYRWWTDWKKHGCEIDALVPRYGLVHRDATKLTDDERAILAGLYLTPKRWSKAHCYNVLMANLPTSQASLDQARRYLNSLPKPLVDLRRLGRERFDNANLPDMDRNPLLFDSMEQVVSDHHCLDFLVHRNGQNFRPWITTFQDYRSGKVLGVCPSIYPSSLSISVAFVRMVALYGAPGMIHVDNGKDYKSRMFKGYEVPMRIFSEDGDEQEALINICGVFEVCGVDRAYARPYHGKSKGRQERLFGAWAQYFSREFPTYLGSDVTERTDDSELYFRSIKGKAKKPVEVSWNEFVTKLEAFVPWWNANWRGQAKGRKGKTADEVFESGWKGKREVDPQMLELAFGRPEVRVVQKCQVQMEGAKYYHENLFAYNGQQVVARRLIHDPDTVVVTHPKGGLIARAVYNPFEDTGDMEENLRRLNRARKDLKAQEKLLISAAPIKGALGFLDKALEAYPNSIADLPALPVLAPKPLTLPMAAGAEHEHPTQATPGPGLRSLLDDVPVGPVSKPFKDLLME